MGRRLRRDYMQQWKLRVTTDHIPKHGTKPPIRLYYKAAHLNATRQSTKGTPMQSESPR